MDKGGLNNRGQKKILLTVHSRLIDIANIDINSKCSKIHRTMTRIEKYQIQRAFHNKKKSMPDISHLHEFTPLEPPRSMLHNF